MRLRDSFNIRSPYPAASIASRTSLDDTIYRTQLQVEMMVESVSFEFMTLSIIAGEYADQPILNLSDLS